MNLVNELAKKVQSGDVQAAQELILELESWVRGRVARRLFAADAIDDVTQITFIEALKHMDRYDPQYDFKNWIAGIANLQSLKYLEKWSTRHKHEKSWSLLQINRLELEKHDVQDDPRHEQLHHCLQKLKTQNAEHYQLFKDKYLNKKPLKALAEELNATIGSLGMKLKRIREQLKTCLESQT